MCKVPIVTRMSGMRYINFSIYNRGVCVPVEMILSDDSAMMSFLKETNCKQFLSLQCCLLC